ncbi:DsbA family protein [Sporolactobacillus shoreicorticis]|uniref:DsbA family protein n=1 Tax=Sporolactobacillus shoreicorticis TaxID=1923877 RepID=A0ABW5S5K6_9BACL|nr:thioredoxin domain-containing protein [Sporolactobacillus shoreicorticis]MCO7127399.1 DsbA family protein [Sporolactobacillus shoreicorticis]
MSETKHSSKGTNDPKKGRIVIFSSIIVIVLVAAIAIMVYSNLNHKETKPKKQPTHRTEQTTRIDYQGQPFIGSSKAPVKVAVFSDYRCPYCKQFEETVVPKLEKEYINTGKISLYFFNDTVLGPGSVLAANASEEVYHQNPKAFWAFHKAVFAAQKDEKEQWVTKKLLTDIAKKTVPSIDLKAFENALNTKSRQDDVNKDESIAESVGVPGTPAIFVGDKMLEDGLNYDLLKQSINSALKGSK